MSDLSKIIDQLSKLTVVEAAELSKQLDQLSIRSILEDKTKNIIVRHKSVLIQVVFPVKISLLCNKQDRILNKEET